MTVAKRAPYMTPPMRHPPPPAAMGRTPSVEATHLAESVVESASGTAIAMLLALIGLCLVVCWMLTRTFKDLVVESERLKEHAQLRRDAARMSCGASPQLARLPFGGAVGLAQYGKLGTGDDEWDGKFEPVALKPFRECFSSA